MRKSMIALAATGLFAFAAPASADPLTITIHVTQADVQDQESVAALYQRVNDAARSVCRNVSRQGLAAAPTRNTCIREAVSRALDGADIAALSDFHEAVHDDRAPAPAQAAAQ